MSNLNKRLSIRPWITEKTWLDKKSTATLLWEIDNINKWLKEKNIDQLQNDRRFLDANISDVLKKQMMENKKRQLTERYTPSNWLNNENKKSIDYSLDVDKRIDNNKKEKLEKFVWELNLPKNISWTFLNKTLLKEKENQILTWNFSY